jgi:DNA-binding HxlR family transcriptional regulator
LEESEPFFRKEVVKAIEESRGQVLVTTAGETIKATGLLARTEGIFAEPASASVVASLQTAKARGLINAGETVVCIVTGAGLKDTKAISRLARATRRVSAREDNGVAPAQIGETKVRIVRSLATRPRFGYELWKRLSLGKRISTASVYQHLGELEGLALVRKAGVVRVGGRERILYELTRKGADFLKITEKLNRAGRSEAE